MQPALPLSTPPTGSTLDALGCDRGQAHDIQEVRGEGVHLYRSRVTAHSTVQVDAPASARGVLVGVSLAGGHRRRIFQGRRSTTHDFDAQSVYVRSFADDFRAELSAPFDFLLLEISSAALQRVADERSGRSSAALQRITGVTDPVLAHLALALAPALNRPHEASPLFLAQVSTAIETHLFERYGNTPAASVRTVRALSPVHEHRAKELLRSRLDGQLTIAAVADACGLSRSHFVRAFRQTTGQSPHQWLQGQRVAQARELLGHPGGYALAEIAALCGFADQSHFTRVFQQWEGVTPGRWRQVGAR